MGMTSDDFESLLNAADSKFNPLSRGEIRTATIMRIEDREIIVDLGAKQDGIVTNQDIDRMDDEFFDSLTVGQEVPVYIITPSDKDSNLIVSINMGLQRYDWEDAARIMTEEDVVDVKIFDSNKGGVLGRWRRLEGFIPSSHLTSLDLKQERFEAMRALRGATLHVKIIEVDQDRRRLIFSEREAEKEWRLKQKAQLLDNLNVGDVVQGKVTGLRDFGAFVDIGGADGLIHVSELAWHRVDHPRDILSLGDEIDVYILDLDKERNRIALSLKRLQPDPWETAISQFHEGQLVEGSVTNVVDFGAFVALDNGLEGLLHLSEMGDGTLKEPYSYVQKGDRLTLRISHLEPEKRRVGFTQRWGTPDDTTTDSDAGASSDDVTADSDAANESALPDDAPDTIADDDADVTSDAETIVRDINGNTTDQDDNAS